MKSKLREQAVSLRVEKEWSYTQIREKLSIPKSTLSYWLRDLPLSEKRITELRKKSWLKGEASRERYRNTMREKKEEKRRNIYKEESYKFKEINDQSYYVAGLMLYLAEGSKTKDSQINIANTDPEIISFFIRWLSKFFHINKSHIKIQLHLYKSMNIANEENFWKNTLRIKEDQLYKTQVRKLRKGSFSYKSSHGHGTCSLYIMGVQHKMRLMMAIRAFLDSIK